MDAKHTPGPWFVLPLSTTMGAEEREPGSFSIGTSEDASKAKILCSRFPWPECADEMRANAHLIAAAPELAGDLEAAANYIDTLGGDSKKYRITLAKATGA